MAWSEIVVFVLVILRFSNKTNKIDTAHLVFRKHSSIVKKKKNVIVHIGVLFKCSYFTRSSFVKLARLKNVRGIKTTTTTTILVYVINDFLTTFHCHAAVAYCIASIIKCNTIGKRLRAFAKFKRFFACFIYLR